MYGYKFLVFYRVELPPCDSPTFFFVEVTKEVRFLRLPSTLTHFLLVFSISTFGLVDLQRRLFLSIQKCYEFVKKKKTRALQEVAGSYLMRYKAGKICLLTEEAEGTT